jgi:DNA-directed RNA polymerase specialized sigma24 family protein
MKRNDDLYRELLVIALGEVDSLITRSAALNLNDEVAAIAVEEYLRKVAAGLEVDNPRGFVRKVARDRAMDALKRWNRLKKKEQRVDENGYEAADFGLATDLGLGWGTDDMTDRFLEAVDAIKEDDADRTIARMIWIGRAEVDEAAAVTGLAPKTVRNRMTRIEKAVRRHLLD